MSTSNQNYIIYVTFSIILSAQSPGAVEYADCISAEDKTPTQTSDLDMTLNNLMVRLQFWSLEECRVPLPRNFF